MKKKTRRVLLVLALLLLAMAAAFFLYTGRYYRAEETALACLQGSDAVTVERSGSVWRFDGAGTETALIFYPGAKVEAAAYAPLLTLLAERGVDCFLVEMPFHLALLGINSADTVMARYSYPRWCLAGHSLGGVAASYYTAAHPDTVDALILLASFPTKALGEHTRLLSVYGSSDGVLNPEAYEKARPLWPATAEEEILPGGNHAQFGAYGVQKGDGEAAISAPEQWRLTADTMIRFLNRTVEEAA